MGRVNPVLINESRYKNARVGLIKTRSSTCHWINIMKILNAQEVKQVSGGALDPELGIFKPTGIALIDAIHKNEWNTYGRPLYNTFAVLLGFPKAP